MSRDLPERNRRLFAKTFSEITGEGLTVDFGALIERLIIADEYVIHSRNLQEIPYLVERFGAGPVSRLFTEDDVSICVEQAHMGLIEDRSAASDPYMLHTAAIRLEQPDSSEHDLENLNDSLSHLRTADRNRIQDSISDSLMFAEGGLDSSLRDDFYNAVQTKARVYPYLENALERMGVASAGRAFSFSAEAGSTVTSGRLQGTRLRIETDLEESYGLAPGSVGRAVREAILGLSEEVGRVNEMRAYDAVSEFNERDMPLFGAHIDFLWSKTFPDEAKENLHRVIEVTDVPDFRSPRFISEVDLDTLVEVRKSDEAKAFREWLWGIGALDEADVVKGMNALSHPLVEKIGRALASSSGRTLRVLVAAAGSAVIGGAVAGLAGVAVGPTLGVANLHLVERFAESSPAPLSFVRNGYQSLFRNRQ